MVKLVLLSSAFALAVTTVNAQVAVYGQCGGQGYTGSTSCASGSTCVFSNDWYSQCLPGATAATTTSKTSTTKSSTTKTTKTSTTKTSTTKTTKSSTTKTTQASSTTSKATTVTVTSTVLPPTTTTTPPTSTGLPGYPACQGKDYNGAEGGPWCFAQFEPTCSDKGLGAPSDLPADFPKAQGQLSCDAPRLIANGTTFDGKLANNGKLVRYDRGPNFRQRYGDNCLSVEPGEESVVFVLGHGATLKNVIIGQEIGDAIYCYGDCHLENIYWEKICEDGWSIKYAGTNPQASLKGGMIYGFTDKAIQHNSGGTVSVEDLDIWYTTGGKMYRSCGDCPKPDSYDNRKFVGTNIRVHGKKAGSFVRVNGDRGDTATLKQINFPENFGSTKYPVCDTSGLGKFSNEGDGKICLYKAGDISWTSPN